MRRFTLSFLVLSLIAPCCFGQQLTSDDKSIVQSARMKYYNLEVAGFQSLICSVKFDFSTVPLLSPAKDDPIRKLVEGTEFTLTVNDRELPTLMHVYPGGSSAETQRQASPLTGLLTSLVVGLFQTWASKGLRGPIPPFDAQIQSVVKTDDGYTVNLSVPGSPVQVFMDKNFLVRRITSIGGKIDEKPTYILKPEGLVFAANEVVDNSEAGGPVTVKYELDSSVVDGLRMPSSVRLRVNDNIDTKFDLSKCLVKKAMVLQVDPPPEVIKR